MNNSAILLAKKTLPISLRFEFTEISLILSRYLLRHFSILDVNNIKFHKYLRIYKEQYSILVDENGIQEFVSILDFIENSRFKFTPNLKVRLVKYYNKIKHLLIKKCSIETLMLISKVVYNKYLQDTDYLEFKKVIKIIIQKVFEKKFKSHVAIELIVNLQLRIALINKDYYGVNLIYDDYFKKVNTGNYNWFVLNIYYILTLIHCKNYSDCYPHLLFILKYPTFGKQPSIIKESIYIIEAYTNFLIKVGKIKIENPKEFRLSKFFNQVPEFTKDKQGINIPIILVQILFFLVEKSYNKLIDRMDSLNLYSYRYLKKDETFRSQCFIKMISEMIRAGFRKKGTLVRTQKWLEKLLAVPIVTYPEALDHEIIPYEDLWDMVLQLLD